MAKSKVGDVRPIGRQPVTSPDRRYIQVQFLDKQMLLLPVDPDQANMAIAQWENGSPKISLYPNDGTAFHVAATQILYLRQVTEDVAAKMLEESNEHAKRINESNARVAAEQQRQFAHNEEMRELQKTQMAKSGVIRPV